MSETKRVTKTKEVEVVFEGEECSTDCPFYCESYFTDRCGDRIYSYYCSLYDEGDIVDEERLDECVEEFGKE